MSQNLIEIENLLKGLPDQQLTTEMRSPSGSAPPFMIISEMQRRKTMRDSAGRPGRSPGSTIANNLIQSLQRPQQGAEMQRLGSTPMPPQTQPGQQAQPGQQPQGFAEGGSVGLSRDWRARARARVYDERNPEPGLVDAGLWGFGDIGEGLSALGGAARDMLVAPVAIAEEWRDTLAGRNKPFDDKKLSKVDAEIRRQALENERLRRILSQPLATAPNPEEYRLPHGTMPMDPEGERTIGFAQGGRVTNRTVMNGLIDRGFSREEAAAITGNIAIESQFDTGALGDNGTAFGLMQWRFGRREALERLAAERGVSPNNLDVQLDFATHELRRGGEHGAFKRAMSEGQSLADRTYLFSKYVERPQDPAASRQLRGDAAHHALTAYLEREAQGGRDTPEQHQVRQQYASQAEIDAITDRQLNPRRYVRELMELAQRDEPLRITPGPGDYMGRRLEARQSAAPLSVDELFGVTRNNRSKPPGKYLDDMIVSDSGGGGSPYGISGMPSQGGGLAFGDVNLSRPVAQFADGGRVRHFDTGGFVYNGIEYPNQEAAIAAQRAARANAWHAVGTAADAAVGVGTNALAPLPGIGGLGVDFVHDLATRAAGSGQRVGQRLIGAPVSTPLPSDMPPQMAGIAGPPAQGALPSVYMPGGPSLLEPTATGESPIPATVAPLTESGFEAAIPESDSTAAIIAGAGRYANAVPRNSDMDKFRADLDAFTGNQAERREENTNLALMKAGMAMMSAHGNLFDTVGQGGMVGTQSYQEGLKGIRDEQFKKLALEGDLAKVSADQQAHSFDVGAQLQGGIEQARVAGEYRLQVARARAQDAKYEVVNDLTPAAAKEMANRIPAIDAQFGMGMNKDTGIAMPATDPQAKALHEIIALGGPEAAKAQQQLSELYVNALAKARIQLLLSYERGGVSPTRPYSVRGGAPSAPYTDSGETE